MDEQIMELWHIYSMEYYSAIKKNEILSFATTSLDLEGIILGEINQTEKDNTVWSFLHMKSLGEKKRFIDTEKKLVVPRGVWDDIFLKR